IDVTKIINPVTHQGQIDGGIVQGVGFSLMEGLEVNEGRITNLHLGDYKIPNVQDIPRLTTSHVLANAGPGPFGTKAVAECGISVIAPAIANAVYNATGVRMMDAPITPEKVVNGLQRLTTASRPSM
ncbi:MAG: molybdopterin-dependent oxidoreductase, partial [Deltaproteobacteria bacterium]|nr:molybdopterin-dependent oxidoreductase [Deltaproteobacteria bacterium]